MLAYLLLWLLALAVSVASVPLTIRMLRSPEWQTTSWPWSRWRYWPLLVAPIFVAVVGLSILLDGGYSSSGGAPTSGEFFMMVVFLIAASLYVLFVSQYNSRHES